MMSSARWLLILLVIVQIGGARFLAEVADTSAKRAQGLSGRGRLALTRGMLFLFDAPGHYSFWMKDMKFPLDFVWIRGDRVVGVTERVPAPRRREYLRQYPPPSATDTVLEVNAGIVKLFGIRPGDRVTITPWHGLQ